MENTNMINLTPDIDWTKQTMVMYTGSGVTHAKKPQSQWSTFYREIRVGSYRTCVYISEKDNYLSVKSYHYQGWRVFGRVGSFKDAAEEDTYLKVYLDTHGIPLEINGKRFEVADVETRIYKDRRMAYVLQAHFVNETEMFYVVYTKGSTVKQVNTDEEIEKYAVIPSEKTIRLLLPALSYCAFITDLRNKRIYGSQNEGTEFTQATKKLIIDFFKLDTNTDLKNRFLHKAVGSAKSDVNTALYDLRDFKTLLLVKDTTKQANNKQDRVIKLKSQLDAWTTGPSTDKFPHADWYRIGDEIILLHTPSSCVSSGRRMCRRIFTYNVKTKKRFYAEWDGNNKVWNFPIPSYQYIKDQCDLDDYYDWDYNSSKYYPVKTIIHCQNGVSELFAGSNIGWILDNVDQSIQIIATRRSERHEEPVSFKELINNSRIHEIVYPLIFSTGEPVLEQFLKSKLFNLYFKAIEDYKLDDWLRANTSDSKITSTYNTYYWETPELEYLSKAKNLKKMFGMSMDQLRVLDSKYTVKKYIDDKDNSHSYYRGQYRLYGVEAFLGHNLSDLDMESFTRLLSLVEGVRQRWNGYSLRGVGITTLLRYTFLKDLSIKQKLDLLSDIIDSGISGNSFEDYYRMRAKLQLIQSAKPEIPDIWNEKRYPLIPKAGTRFVSYVEGAVDPIFVRRLEARSMCQQYHYRFSGSAMQEVIGADGKLVGLLLKLSGGDMIRFLHDEMSYWIDFYQNAANNALFVKAIERVKPLCWKDEKSGLEIIAPRDISDLKNEGHVLSHCVGTYVDAIIGGQDNIMFLRRSDMVDDPFYTVEVLNDGQIRQVHCYQNGSLTTDAQQIAHERSGLAVYDRTFNIVQFLLDWSKAMKGKIKANSIKSSYGALCAVR